MDDSIDLGSNYRYIQDYPQTILYHMTEKYNGGGLEAVPPIVVRYKWNDRYIIAKNIDWEDNHTNYWIIDKEIEFSEIKPMDSLSFYFTLEEKKIGLKLN
jgi:hypothetical protein